MDESFGDFCLAEPLTAGVTRGVFSGVDDSGRPLVEFAASPTDEPLPALSVATLTRADIGKPVILSFEDGDLLAPVILGVVRPVAVVEAGPDPRAEAVVDGERVVIGASREIVLR